MGIGHIMIRPNMEQFVSTFSASGQAPKETCRQCRFRKVRCDGKHGERGCGDCERLRFDCSFAAAAEPATPSAVQPAAAATRAESIGSSLPSPTTTEAGRVVERRRTSKACTHCRLQKVRCSGGASCTACKKKGLACVYGTDRRRGSRVVANGIVGTPTETTFPGHMEDVSGAEDTSAPSPTTSATTNSEPVTATATQPRPAGYPLLPPEIQVLVEFYFNHVYPLPSYAFLHPQTTISQCGSGTLEPCLSYAISAVASHHGGGSQARGDTQLGWIQAAEELIWKNLESLTIARLQALLLIVLYRLETGGFQRAFMLSSLAARGAAAMRLNYERTDTHNGQGRLARETRRRLMWSLKLVERYFSMGLPEFELCPVESVYLELPCWEEEFSSSPTGDARPQRDVQSSDFGSYRLCVKLEMLRRDIVKLGRSVSTHDGPSPGLPAAMRDFEQHLERLGRELPDGPALAADRISQLVDTPWLSRQVLVHLSFHQCHCDLYRLLLRGGYREAAPAAVLDAAGPDLLARAERLCLRHATAVVDVLATLNQLSRRAQLLEFDTAICGYHAARILLFLARSGGGPSSSSPSASSPSVSSSSSSSPSLPSPPRPGEEWALSRAELCLASLRRFFPASRLVRPVLEEMKRAVAVFSTRGANGNANGTPGRLASPGPTVGGGGGGGGGAAKDPTAGLSAAARVRQRLAIHSLLRQADFTDEDEGREERKESVSNHYVTSPGVFSQSSPFRAPGSSGLAHDASGTSSSQSVSSPQTPGPLDSEPWQLSWFEGADSADRWAPAKVHSSVAGAGIPPTGTPPLSFPWLQRWEGTAVALRDETA